MTFEFAQSRTCQMQMDLSLNPKMTRVPSYEIAIDVTEAKWSPK
jgi:hypothetical protein